jgi:serine/threonine-protein kinase
MPERDKANPELRKIPDNLPALLRPPGILPAEEARERFWNMAAIMFAAVFALATVGWWAYGQVRDSMHELRAAGLASLLESELKVLTIWVDEKKRDAERWGTAEAVQREARKLVQLSGSGIGAAAVCRAPARAALLAQIAPFIALEEAAVVNLIGRDGAIIASMQDEYCGLTIASAEFARRLAPVYAGRTVFVRPFEETDRIGAARDVRLKRPLVWVETPVLSEDGQVIAALGFGRYADERFGTLLALTSGQSSREAYLFDAQGTMLTQSRFLGDLRAAGRVAKDDSGILRVPVRDPGGDLIAGFRPTNSWREWPLTRLAAEVIAARESGGNGAIDGIILEPYRNYRGTEVIGAWHWIAEKEMAMAVEIEATEAYAPLKHLELAFSVLFAFVLVAILAALASSLWAMRLSLREARRVGQYTLEREIGEGGISRVYLARHSHLKRPTAVKVLKTALATDEMVTRFEREVQLCSRLSHPNTIEIYDYGRTRDGTFYYAMEYLEGITLEALVRADGPMPVSRAVHALRQVCGSLKEAHAQGLVHRDIKPQNLMLCRRGGECDVVKVLDFGLVKEVANEHTRDITQFARVLGTPLYMAPERLRNPADADARSDIYAVGAVAYFLLSGKRVFETESDHDLVYRVLNEPAPSLAEAGIADIPGALVSLVARCLAKDRGERPATMEKVSSVLWQVARERPWREADARAWWAVRARELGIGEPAPHGENVATAKEAAA